MLELIRKITYAGCLIDVIDGELEFENVRGDDLPPALWAEIKKHKEELVNFLTADDEATIPLKSYFFAENPVKKLTREESCRLAAEEVPAAPAPLTPPGELTDNKH